MLSLVCSDMFIRDSILLAHMQRFVGALLPTGQLFLICFYTEHIPPLTAEAARYGLHLKDKRTEDNWTMLLLQKD